MMGSPLQHVLRSLFLNTGWKYAVFWKLEHRTKMMFTWEDAYYDGSRYIEDPYSHDPLRLAVAKMSYQVYSLGEGVVGKVAVSGKHSWTFSDEEHVADSFSSPENYGGWQAQFQAGIKTIAVVAVIPHGVVQLGSLHKIPEDLNLVDLIRSFYSELQDSFTGHIPCSVRSSANIHSSRMVTYDLPSEFPSISPFSFGAGYELYEALGPSFQRQNNDSSWESGKTVPNMTLDVSEGISSCNFLMDNKNSSDMQLLEAVVANAGSHSKGCVSESEKSCNKTCESLLTAEKTPCNSIDNISSCGVKMNKKRARPGESSRPRPRDRQLIQDRIKDLRELVPNGSKCSIDSLLERTIKHTIFLQGVTKHAEKLKKCSASKLLDKETGIRRFSSRDQGSSWAVEVGNNQTMCPIIVENINMNGQMLVEVLSKECNQFLEVAETIRSLGLTILKSASEAFGNQTWMCFVVEGQNNRRMHRMDVLWSLIQLLLPKLSG